MVWLAMRWRSFAEGVALPATVLLLGTGLAAAAGFAMHRNIQSRMQGEFERLAASVAADVERRIQAPLAAMHGARGVYAASKSVERAEFRAYVETHDLEADFPGVRGFGFVQRVWRADLPAFMERERADEAPDFALRQIGNAAHDDLYVQKFIAPQTSNWPALGLDLGSELRRRAALESAVARGEPTLSAPLTLVQDEQRRTAMLLAVPVFRTGTDPATAAQRRAALVGLVVAPLVVQDLLSKVVEAHAARADFEVFDGASVASDAVVAESRAQPALMFSSVDFVAQRAGGVKPQPHASRWEQVRLLALPGRDLSLRVRSASRFEAEVPFAPPWLAFGAGALVSALLAALLQQQAGNRRRAEALIQKRLQAALRDNAALLGALDMHALVSVTDAAGTIIDANDGFCRISGYTRAELLGQNHRLLNSHTHPPAFWAAMWQTLSAGTPWRGEVCNRAKDGTLYWVDAFIAPFRGADGQIEKYISIRRDITAEKNIARELARERRRLANIIEGTHVGTWEWDIETGECHFNERWAEIAGYTLEELAPVSVETFRRLAHAGDADRSAAIMERHFDGVTPNYECELRMQHKAGHWVWVLARGKLFSRTADGRPRWMAGTHMDISQRKAAESALNESQAFLDRTGRIGGVGGWQLDLANKSLVWTDQTRRIYGRENYTPTPEESYQYYEPTSQLMLEAAMHTCIVTGDRFDLELAATSARGRAFWVRVVGEAERVNGRTVRVLGAVQDITARRMLEADLRRNNDVLHNVVENLPCGLSVYDGALELVAANSEYRRLLDLPDALFETPPVRFIDVARFCAARGEYGGADEAGHEAAVQALLLRVMHPTRQHRLERLRHDGLPLEIRGAPMPGGGFVTTYFDVSEHKRLESELRRATEAAQEASRMKSQFLANMSHEIRTPMNAILGMLKLLGKTELSARQADYTAKTEGAARSLLGLLNDILDFSKVEAGKMTLDPHPFHIDRLLRDLSVILAASVGSKPVEVLFDIDPALPRHLVGDAMRLQQVLINLSGNAIKFTPEGEVVVSLAVRERSADTVTIEFAVRDTGIGIAPENQARIFAGFTQAEASTTRRFGGTGLGVAISHRLVALMGGELGLDSAPGRGSRFHFRVTLALAPEEAVGAAAASAPVTPAWRVLVVDDNPTAREVLQRMGQSLGWDVDTAAGGEEALTLMQRATGAERPYRAVFVDWQMPGLDGWQTSERIRQLGLGEPAPVVVMVTAHGHEQLAQRGGDEQALLDRYLVKPVTASMLFDAVVDARAQRDQPHPSRGQPSAGQVRRLQGMRLLVAEDNPNNQQVARELLEDEGAVVQIAQHGKEAVEAVAAADPPFDVVLMDLQMPVMDGLAATRAIRTDLGQTRLPIVAMTANAMASDRDACLAAGMDDHVGKPFDLDHLVRVLKTRAKGWAARRAGTDADPAGAAPAAVVPAAPVALALAPALAQAAEQAGVDLSAALARLGGRQDVYQRLLRSFAADLPATVATLQAHAGAGDHAEASRSLHTIKGLAATLGISALAAQAAALERAFSVPGPAPDALSARAADLALLAAGVPAAQAGLAALAQALHPAPARDAAPGAAGHDKSAPDAAELRQALHDLQSLLRNSDMAATDAMQTLAQRMGGTLPAPLQALDDAVAALDFARALGLCKELMEEAAS